MEVREYGSLLSSSGQTRLGTGFDNGKTRLGGSFAEPYISRDECAAGRLLLAPDHRGSELQTVSSAHGIRVEQCLSLIAQFIAWENFTPSAAYYE